MSDTIFVADRQYCCRQVDAIVEGGVREKEGKGKIFEVSIKLIKNL